MQIGMTEISQLEHAFHAYRFFGSNYTDAHAGLSLYSSYMSVYVSLSLQAAAEILRYNSLVVSALSVNAQVRTFCMLRHIYYTLLCGSIICCWLKCVRAFVCVCVS